jgi:hypothetical protein
MSDDTKTRLRAEILQMLRRVPASVNRGSVQLARQYHVAASLGMRAANSPRSTLETLQDAAARLKKFEG